MTRVLVIEKEESFSGALSYLLRKDGFEVAVCPTGPGALEAFERDGADLVLLDLMLDGPPGTEVCRSLRRRSDVPVIMLSVKDTEVDKTVGLELGADDYVTKPFSWRELAARIRAVLRHQGETAESPAAALEGATGAHGRRHRLRLDRVTGEEHLFGDLRERQVRGEHQQQTEPGGGQGRGSRIARIPVGITRQAHGGSPEMGLTGHRLT
jgi:DNA-binding response OmpR family regulator